MVARRQIVLALVAALEPIVCEIKTLTRQIATAWPAHPDGEIFRSGVSRSLAGDAGQAPVAVESGNRKVACYRWACNKRLRDAVCTRADSTHHWHPWAQDRYAAARARGQDHQRAIRTLGRAWCRVLWRCWQDGRPYDPARHRGLQQHIAVTIPKSSGPRLDLAATQRMAGAAVTHKGGPTGRARSA